MNSSNNMRSQVVLMGLVNRIWSNYDEGTFWCYLDTKQGNRINVKLSYAFFSEITKTFDKMFHHNDREKKVYALIEGYMISNLENCIKANKFQLTSSVQWPSF